MAQGFNAPVDQVRTMRAQGYDNRQIIATLQRDGYPAALITEAFNKSDVVPASAVSSRDADMVEVGPPPSPDDGGDGSVFSGASLAATAPQFQEHVSALAPAGGGTETEELVEAIIDEKWNEMVKDINKIIDWKNAADARLIKLESRFVDLQRQFDKVYQALIGKVNEYDRHIQEVGAELKAMEKVFSKVLPSFTDNVKELGRITEELRSPPPRPPGL